MARRPLAGDPATVGRGASRTPSAGPDAATSADEDASHDAAGALDASGSARTDAAVVARQAAAGVARLAAAPLAPGLYLVATPIGNLGDITLRALATLARADVIYCEDTRHSRTLLAHYGIAARLRPYHDHNADDMRPVVLADIAAGRVVALISDAGLPLVSDPGYKLVRDAIAAGHRVETLPGPSAPTTALAASGLPTDAFLFAGFLPPKQSARRTRIGELKAVPATLILFEAPQRLADALADLAQVLGPRPAVVARELTKLYEEHRRGTLAELAQWAAEANPRGEIVVLVGPPLPEETDTSDAALAERLTVALSDMSLRDAARVVAEATGVPRARVYDIGLALKRERDAT